MSGEAAWYVEIFYSVTFTFSTSIGMGVRLVDEKLQFFKNGSFININFIFIYIYFFMIVMESDTFYCVIFFLCNNFCV